MFSLAPLTKKPQLAPLQLVRESQNRMTKRGGCTRSSPPPLSLLSGFSQPFCTQIPLYWDSAGRFPVLFLLGPHQLDQNPEPLWRYKTRQVWLSFTLLHKGMWPFGSLGLVCAVGWALEIKVICVIPGKRCRVGIPRLGQVPPIIIR